MFISVQININNNISKTCHCRTSHAWTGLYSVDLNTGYWQGTCSALAYSYWAPAQTYSSSSPCTYMASSDLRWYYDDCTSQHHVVCQIPNGNQTTNLTNLTRQSLSSVQLYSSKWKVDVNQFSYLFFDYHTLTLMWNVNRYTVEYNN